MNPNVFHLWHEHTSTEEHFLISQDGEKGAGASWSVHCKWRISGREVGGLYGWACRL
jgi:hypothetical protein